MNKLQVYTFIIFLLSCMIMTTACKKYLDAKPDKSLVEPRKVSELQGILDQSLMSIMYPGASEMANDNINFNYANWAAITNGDDKKIYTWQPDVDLTTDWQNSYIRILNTNVVLSVIDDLKDSTATIGQRNLVKGSAYFFRAINLYELAQLFSPAYSTASGTTNLGIPLKDNPDVESKTTRSTVQQTYDFIIADITKAISLLPDFPSQASYKTRPSKAAAYGLLARIYLLMGDYTKAGNYADSCLTITNTLLDYNNTSLVSITSNTPFKQFNAEVIFHASSYNYNSSASKVDSALYNSYNNNDIRKKAYWRSSSDGWWRFKGNYNGSSYSQPFSGIATDEIYLIRAECYARQNDITNAMQLLNALLVKRWKTGTYTPYSATTQKEALDIVLTERRKELCFRPSLRWSDLRRLNLESDYAVTLRRYLNGTVYELPPNDLRYTFLIPNSVIVASSINQNPR